MLNFPPLQLLIMDSLVWNCLAFVYTFALGFSSSKKTDSCSWWKFWIIIFTTGPEQTFNFKATHSCHQGRASRVNSIQILRLAKKSIDIAWPSLVLHDECSAKVNAVFGDLSQLLGFICVIWDWILAKNLSGLFWHNVSWVKPWITVSHKFFKICSTTRICSSVHHPKVIFYW